MFGRVFASLSLLAAAAFGDDNSSDVPLVNYQWYCDLELQPVVTLTWNDHQGRYVLPEDYQWPSDNDIMVDSNNNPNNNHQQRHLKATKEIQSNTAWRSVSLAEPAISLSFSRFLLANEDDDVVQVEHITSTNTTNTSATTTDNGNSTGHPPTVEARFCSCWHSAAPRSPDAFFCPSQQSHCAIPASHYYSSYTSMHTNSNSGNLSNDNQFKLHQPGCTTIQQQRRFARSVWPIVSVFFLAMLLCLLCTIPGRHAMGYCVAGLTSNRYNQRVIQRYIQADPDMADRIVFQSMARRADERAEAIQYRANLVAMQLQQQMQAGTRLWLPPDLRPPPPQMQLKTRKYSYTASSSSDFDQLQSSFRSIQNNNSERGDEDDQPHRQQLLSCTICHMDIQEGDRVGDLPCNHIFHVDPCLKSWLVRRNVCPLCLTEDIAAPIFQSNTSTSDQSNHNRSNDNNYDGDGDLVDDHAMLEMVGMWSSSRGTHPNTANSEHTE